MTARASSTRRRPTARGWSGTARRARSASTPTATSSSTRASAAAHPTSCCSTLTRRSSSVTRATRASACGCTRSNSAARGRRLYKVVSVLDLAGFGMGHMKILNLLKTYNALFAWHYPESIAKFVVINAPLPFTAAWRVIKGFMHPITVQKVHIVGSNYESRPRRHWRRAAAGARRSPPPARQSAGTLSSTLLARPGHDGSHAAGRLRAARRRRPAAQARPPAAHEKVFVISSAEFEMNNAPNQHAQRAG